MADDIVSHAISVIQCLSSYASWRPKVRGPIVLLIFCRGDHCVKHVLERPVESGWLRADVVCWIAWEDLSREAKGVSLELAVGVQPQVEGAFGRSVRHLSSWKAYMIFPPRVVLSVSVYVQVGHRVLLDEVLEVADWVDACIGALRVLEAAIWPHWFNCDPRLLRI